MNITQFLKDKYHRDINLSDLHGAMLELDTLSCGIVRGTYQYAGLHFEASTNQLKESNVIILSNIDSENLLKTYTFPKLLASTVLTFYPEDIKDISIL